MDFDKYILISDWKQPCDEFTLICHAYILFRARCANNHVEMFNSVSQTTISKVEQEKNPLSLDTLKKTKIETVLLPVLRDYVTGYLNKGCLGYPKAVPYKDDGRWVITPEHAEKINEYWRSMAKEEDEDIFLIPVKDIEAHNPVTSAWEKIECSKK